MTTTSGFGGCVVVSQDAKQAKTDPAKSSQPGSSQPAQRAAERDAEDDGAVHTNGDKRHHSRHVPRTLRNKSFKRNCVYCLDLTRERGMLMICQSTQGLLVIRMSKSSLDGGVISGP